MSSIEATIENAEVLDGVREVRMDSFTLDESPMATDEGAFALAEEIKNSGEVNPLIVGIDEKGPYIIEGAHRYDALKLLGAKSFPAIVAKEPVSDAPVETEKVKAEPKDEPKAEPKAEATPEPKSKMASRLIELGIPENVAPKTEALIQNVIDNKKYTTILHPSNKNARKVFTEITGVKLPKTIKGTVQAISDWKSGVQQPAESKKGFVEGAVVNTGSSSIYKTTFLYQGKKVNVSDHHKLVSQIGLKRT